MNKTIYVLIGIIMLGTGDWLLINHSAGIVSAAPYYNFSNSILPSGNSTYYLGTTTPSTNAWKSIITDKVCLTGDVCRTTWPTGGGGVSDWLKETNYGVLTLTASTTIPYWAKDAIYASSTIIATGNITTNGIFTSNSTSATSTFAGGLSLTGGGISSGFNFSTTTRFYQNGFHFLTSSTTAAGNLIIGYQSASTTDAKGGLYNTGVGYQVMGKGNVTTAIGNAALGYQALNFNTTGDYNVANGYQALNFNTTGNNNVANGYQALSSNTTGNTNTANGNQALYKNFKASSSTAS